MTLCTFDNGVTYSLGNWESKDFRQVPISHLKKLKLGDVPDTTAMEDLPWWVAPWNGKPSASLQEAAQASCPNSPWLQALNLEEQLPDIKYSGAEPQPQAAPSLPAQAVKPTPGAESAGEWSRWTLARRARAAPGGVYVRTLRGSRVSEQEAGDMT